MRLPVCVAGLIRRFHDAVTGFAPPAGARWQALIPAEGPCDIIAHHDLAPWGCAHRQRGQRPCGLR
jgi:hypothetical protein